MEFTTVATQTDHMKKMSFSNYLQKSQSRYTHASLDIHMQTHLDDDFNIPTVLSSVDSPQVYTVKFGIRQDRQYCP